MEVSCGQIGQGRYTHYLHESAQIFGIEFSAQTHTSEAHSTGLFFFFFFFFCRRFTFYVVAQLEPLLQGGFELPAELKQSLINLLHDLMALFSLQ